MFCSVEHVIAPADVEPESRQSDVGERDDNCTVDEIGIESRIDRLPRPPLMV